MAKVTPLNDIQSLANTLTAKSALNENFDRIEEAFDNTLSRDGSLPNQMEADIDLNSNDLLNVNRIDAAEYFRNGVELSQSVAYSDKRYQLLSGTGVQLDFTLDLDPGSLGNLEISIDGVVQRPGLDFNYTGTQLVFSVAPPAGTDNILIRYDEALPLGIADANSILYTPPSTGQSGSIKQFLDQLWGATYDLGSSLIRYVRNALGAVVRPLRERLEEKVSVKDFGAKGDGVTNDLAAFLAAIAHLETDSDTRGGTLHVPAGHYKLNGTLPFTAYAAGIVHNTYLVGDGEINTVLDFGGAPALSDGVTFNKGAHFGVRDLAIVNAKRDGISIQPGETVGSANYASQFDISRVRIQGSGRDGLRCINAYLGKVDQVWSKDNAALGFNFAGFHTAMEIEGCEASGNGSIGYVINGMTYSGMRGCGADANVLQGYAISNVQGFKVDNCGAESNGRDGWFVFSSTASAAGLVAQSWDVHGMVMEGCYGLSNSLSTPGAYATFLGVTTADARPINIKVIGGSAHGAAGADRAMVLAGASGQINVSQDMFNDSAFSTPDGVSGTVERKNFTVAGRRTVLSLSAPVATSGVLTKVAFDTLSVNTMNAGFASNSVVIPRGVNQVRVVGSAVWAASAAGSRYLEVQKNNLGGLAIPTSRVAAVNALQSQQVVSAPISVVEGDVINLYDLQDTGGALNINNNNNTYLSVEAVS